MNTILWNDGLEQEVDNRSLETIMNNGYVFDGSTLPLFHNGLQYWPMFWKFNMRLAAVVIMFSLEAK